MELANSDEFNRGPADPTQSKYSYNAGGPDEGSSTVDWLSKKATEVFLAHVKPFPSSLLALSCSMASSLTQLDGRSDRFFFIN